MGIARCGYHGAVSEPGLRRFLGALPLRSEEAVFDGSGRRRLEGRDRRMLAIFVVNLFSVDATLFAADVVASLLDANGVLEGRPRLLRLNDEGSIAERYNYVKWFAAALLLFTIARHRRVWTFPGCAVLLFLIDDAVQLHERAGGSLEKRLGGGDSALLAAGGEVLFFALLAVAVFLLLFIARERADLDLRPLITELGALIVVLAVFGVGVDFVHAIQRAVIESEGLNLLLAWLEDGSELFVISLIAAHALQIHLIERHDAD